MLKSLVVNCSLDRRAKMAPLSRAIGKFSECVTVQFRNIDPTYEVEKDVNAVIISGSRARIVNQLHRDMFRHVADLMKRVDLPVLSICYGHQLLCWSFGCEVDTLAEPVIDRFEKVRVVEADEIFAAFGKTQTRPLLAESHNDYVIRNSLEGAGLVLLADSDTCEVEAVRHRRKPFYGVQFHPERTRIKGKTSPDGHRVIESFYRNVVKR
jgi:GMP synthase-like glutamine amidotransferase